MRASPMPQASEPMSRGGMTVTGGQVAAAVAVATGAAATDLAVGVRTLLSTSRVT